MVSPVAVVPATAVISSAAVVPATAVISSAALVPATVVISSAAVIPATAVISSAALVFVVARAAAAIGFVLVTVTTAFSSRQMFQIGPMFGEERRRFPLVALFLVVTTGARGTAVEVFPVVLAGNGSAFGIRTPQDTGAGSCQHLRGHEGGRRAE